MVAALLASIAAADAPRERLGVGVLRRDGVIVPFAAFDGKRWIANWPAPALDLTVPVTLSGIPPRWWGPTGPLASWQVTTAAGTSSVRVVQPDWVDVHCLRQIGLRTDYRAAQPAPPRTAQPYPKDGLAVAPPHVVEPIEILSPSDPQARALLPTLLASFNDAERRTEDQYGHPIARRSREGIEPTIEALYAYGSAPRVFYVEATRVYRQLGQPPDECTAVGIGHGWLMRDAGGTRPLRMLVDVLDCDRRGASYMLPLGVLKLNDRVFWLAQFSGFDHERYAVSEITPKAVVGALNTFGGSC